MRRVARFVGMIGRGIFGFHKNLGMSCERGRGKKSARPQSGIFNPRRRLVNMGPIPSDAALPPARDEPA